MKKIVSFAVLALLGLVKVTEGGNLPLPSSSSGGSSAPVRSVLSDAIAFKVIIE